MPVTLAWAAEDIQFNIDVLDVNDRKNIDLTQFSRSGYIMPGSYDMTVHINKTELPEQQILFYAREGEETGSRACISSVLSKQLGLKEKVLDQLQWWHHGECLDEHSMPGMEIRGDLASNALYLSIPQAYLEYTADNWDPPSRWEEGISGLLLDYNINAMGRQQQRVGKNDLSLSGNGSTGANFGPWRLRADWQGKISQHTRVGQATEKQLDWSRYYLYRAIPSLKSKLTLGEDYLASGLFDTFRFTGASLVSDDNMLPPNLRGYAPEVVGVARTNAKVVISQQGRVLYESTVAAGPFRIQDINDAVSGELNVRVEEQDGSVQEFTMNTASIPYLTRPGMVRYKLASGRPTNWQHGAQGPFFGSGEFSWGINNGWSLYGGALTGGDYNALSLGIGRDLMTLGALSFDATQSRARLPQEKQSLSGGSYRLSYAKNFDEYDSQVTFAGYRFSEQNFMNMNEYLEAYNTGNRNGSGKQMYTFTFNKSFADWGMSAYLIYSHETYWDRPENDRYSLTVSHYFDWNHLRNLSVSLSAYRNEYNSSTDDGGYLSLSVPIGNSATVSYNPSVNRGNTTHSLSYNDRIDEKSSYQLNAGRSRNGISMGGYYTHEADIARLTANASYEEGEYSALGLTAQGGMTLTRQGGGLHRIGMAGSTRLLVDTNGVGGVPVRGYGSATHTNRWGKAVIGDVNSYYRNDARIDVNNLAENAEATRTVVQATLTEGAIGYRQFDVIAGQKMMAMIKLADGSHPPFGASVINDRDQETGIVNDGGSVYLSGINPGGRMRVKWGGSLRCDVLLPDPLPANMLMNTMLLPCHPSDGQTAADK